MNFDELVGQTFTKLKKSSINEFISIESIEQFLKDSGVAELMQGEAAPMVSRRLLIHRVRIGGHRHNTAQGKPIPFCYDRIIQSGLNGWIAGNGAGKSTILKAIIWGLTGVEPNFKPDVRAWLEDIAIEIFLADTTYTIRYFPRSGSTRVMGKIYAHDLETVLNDATHLQVITLFSGASEMTKAIANFFSSQLEFAPSHWVQPTNFSIDLEQKSISWEIYAQALFISADDCTDYLFPHHSVNGKHHQRTLSLYLGLGLIDAVSKLEMEHDKARSEYSFEEKRVIANAQGIRELIGQLENEFNAVEERINSIDMGQSILVDPAYLLKIREQLAQQTSLVTEKIQAEQQLLSGEQEMLRIRDEKQRTCQGLREAIEFKLFMGELTVEQCPHCEQPISQVRVEEEIQTKRCRVCHNELRPISSVEQYKVLLKEEEEKMSELENDLQKLKKEIRKSTKERESAEKDLARYQAELQDLPRQERAGFTIEIRELVDKKGYIRGQIQQLRALLEESHTQKLRELKNKADIFDTAFLQLQASVIKQHRDLLESLEEQTTQWAVLFGVPYLERVLFNNQLDMVIRQAGRSIRFNNMETSEMLRIKIAFHLTLLVLRIANHVGRHPGLLIVDAPGSGEMDEQRFDKILQGFLKIKSQLGNQVQILIASTREELASVCEANQLEYLSEGKTLF
jgi:hypothetical protein